MHSSAIAVFKLHVYEIMQRLVTFMAVFGSGSMSTYTLKGGLKLYVLLCRDLCLACMSSRHMLLSSH